MGSIAPGDETSTPVANDRSAQRPQDAAVLAHCTLLSTLSMDEIGHLLEELTPVTLAAGGLIDPSVGEERALHFVLEGVLDLDDGGPEPRRLERGDVFGEAALVGSGPSERVIARSEARLARLSATAYADLAEAQPRTALHLAEGALRFVAERMERPARQPAPRTSRVTLTGTANAPIPERATGARVADRLPREVAGALVVAGRDGERLVGLHASATSTSDVTPITTSDWEGRDVYRRSAGLVLLEAARRLGTRLQLGPSITSGRLVLVPGGGDRAALAAALDARLSELVRDAIPIEEELWSVEDAIDLFRREDDPHACLLLEDSLETVVTLRRCGGSWAVLPHPLLPDAGFLEDVHVLDHPIGLLLDFGPRIRASLPRRPTSTLELELRAPRYGAPMTRSGAQWLARLGIGSVGTFNRVCVQGRVAGLIRVAEGFHEKRIADVADEIHERSGVRIVAVAGPSSSGKTTFIKRLLVQLRVDGIEPLELSLDDYYLDKDRQTPDANGELDFEELAALDGTRLRADLGALLRGDAVRPPRYDFRQGRSLLRAGDELRLGEQSVLLVEGIHALNPALYGPIGRGSVFRVFVHPAASLAFDRLSSLEPADVRLLRRIVRDRHQRGFTVAETLSRWSSVRRGERLHVFPFLGEADAVFDSSLIYEVSVLRVYAERYLLEVPRDAPQAASARRLRHLLQLFVPIHPDHVPPTSLLREFIGGSGFAY
jgi:uridine kinase